VKTSRPTVTTESSTGTINKKKEKSKKGKKQPLTKNDIGAPTNFQFVLASFFNIIGRHRQQCWMHAISMHALM